MRKGLVTGLNLLKLLEKLDYECVQGSADREIAEVVNDSRKACPGCLFFCIKGVKYDGHDRAAEAVRQGAVALITSKPVEGVTDQDVTVIRVKDTRYAMAFIAAAWYGYPAEKLKVIGITGTKGKTTTTYLVKSILEHAGFKVDRKSVV